MSESLSSVDEWLQATMVANQTAMFAKLDVFHVAENQARFRPKSKSLCDKYGLNNKVLPKMKNDVDQDELSVAAVKEKKLASLSPPLLSSVLLWKPAALQSKPALFMYKFNTDYFRANVKY